MTDPGIGFNIANIIAATMSFILFASLVILPNRLYKEFLRPYRHIFILIGIALVNDAIRKIIGVLWMNELMAMGVLTVMAWTTAFINCLAVGFFIPVFRNIGLLNYIEEHKRIADLKFRSVFEHSPDGIVIADTSSTILDWNDAATHIFGYTNEEIVGKSLTLLMPEEARERHLQGVARFAATGQKHIIGNTVRLVGVKNTSEHFPMELSLATYEIDGKAYFVAMIRDVTQRAKLEKENTELKTQTSSTNSVDA